MGQDRDSLVSSEGKCYVGCGDADTSQPHECTSLGGGRAQSSGGPTVGSPQVSQDVDLGSKESWI